jgi:tetratricopeptide (TPR) repeat protein
MADLRDRLQDALGDVYRLERELPGGGMSRLFLATESSLGRQVVIKLLPPDAAGEVSIARFQREIQTAAHLQHPHILPIHTAGSRGDLLYYVMPYVAGESLRRRLSTAGRLEIDEAVRILREIADALAHAHANGIVHRDIKPENILLQGEHAVLTDFGVARALQESRSGTTLTSTGVSIGTPAYMAPEQIAGERAIDARADVYALAVVGYEMLTGARPFTGASAQAVLAAHMTEPPVPVRQQRPEVPARVSDAIGQALAKDPNARFATMAEFRKSLGASRDSATVIVGGRRRVLAAAALAAVAVAVIAGVLAVRNSGGEVSGDPRRSLIVFPFRNLTGDADREWLESGAANMLGLTLAHWQELTVYDDERTRSLLRQAKIDDPGALDVERARELARKASVGTLILGDIRQLNDTLVVEAKLHDVRTGSRISTEVVRVVASNDPRAAFDSLAARILLVGRVPAGEHPGAVAQTTRSLDAYRLYLAGMDAYQGFHIDSAQRLFRRAIEADSTFALAYLRLTQAVGWNRPPTPQAERLEIARSAERYGTALPSRLRALIQMEKAQIERSQNPGVLYRARTLARTLIAEDSADAEAWYQLGEAEYHHSAFVIPHGDSLGNVGRALRAFERALALDSGYHLAYRHVVDLLFECSASDRILCGRDSAIYVSSQSQSIVDLVGRDSVASAQRRMKASIEPTIRSWIAAEPASREPVELYLFWLLNERRFAEAERQLERVRELGLPRGRDLPYVAMLEFGNERYAEAARAAEPLLQVARDSGAGRFFTGPLSWDFRLGLITWFSAAGRLGKTREAVEALLESPLQGPPCLPLPDGRCVPVPQERRRAAFETMARQAYTGVATEARRALREALGEGRSDSVAHLLYVSGNSASLTAYRLTGDTTVLSEWVRAARDTLWPAAVAMLALARGDTAYARQLVVRHARLDQPLPGPASVVREEVLATRYDWAGILAGLGERRRALAVYEMLDTAGHSLLVPTTTSLLRVLSFAERALLHEQLGEHERAIELYEKFTAAWQDADPELQPMVRRARAAAARLRGGAPDAPRP